MNSSTNPYQFQIEQLEKQIQENQLFLSDPEMATLAQLEIDNLTAQKTILESEAEGYEQAISNSQSEKPLEVYKSDAIFEIRGGAGGDEAKIWASDLMRMYERFAENYGLKIEYIDDLIFKIKGKIKSQDLEKYYQEASEDDGSVQELQNDHNDIIISDSGSYIHPYAFFKYESGVHRVQRVPATESQGRIHTSTASIAVLPVVQASTIQIRDEDLEWQFIRSGGAGGQSVNKTSSAVRLTHTPSGISVHSSRERKQAQNREIALEMLASQLWEIEEEKKLAQIGDARKVIGRNMRAEKIRTYNFPQNRVTDHRINQSWHNLESILDGDLMDVILEVREKI